MALKVAQFRSLLASGSFPGSQRLRMLIQSPLGRATLLAAALTIVCKIVGFFREQVVAASFGVDGHLDAFHVATIIPTLITTIFLQNLSVSLVMEYVRTRTQADADAGRRLLAQGMFWGGLFSVTVAVLSAVSGPALLRVLFPGLAPHLLADAQRMLWWLIPYAAITGVTVFWSALLNAEGRFVVTAFSPGVISVAIVASLWLAGHSDPFAMIVGFTVGAVADLLNLGRSLSQLGLPLMPRCARWDQRFTGLLTASVPLAMGSMLHFGTEVVDQSMASWLGEGSISELKYGNRIVAMVFGVVTIPISQVVFPHLVRLAESQQWALLQQMSKRVVLGTLLVSLPFTLVLVAFSTPIVSWSFERGQFTAESTMQVSAVQAMCAFQLPFYLWGIVLVRVAVAMRMNRLMLWGGILNLTVNVIMNYLLMKPLGVTGIALSTAIVYLGSACYFSAAIGQTLRRKVREAQEMSFPVGVESNPVAGGRFRSAA